MMRIAEPKFESTPLLPLVCEPSVSAGDKWSAPASELLRKSRSHRRDGTFRRGGKGKLESLVYLDLRDAALGPSMVTRPWSELALSEDAMWRKMSMVWQDE